MGVENTILQFHLIVAANLLLRARPNNNSSNQKQQEGAFHCPTEEGSNPQSKNRNMTTIGDTNRNSIDQQPLNRHGRQPSIDYWGLGLVFLTPALGGLLYGRFIFKQALPGLPVRLCSSSFLFTISTVALRRQTSEEPSISFGIYSLTLLTFFCPSFCSTQRIRHRCHVLCFVYVASRRGASS